jgi:hypothetical protein
MVGYGHGVRRGLARLDLAVLDHAGPGKTSAWQDQAGTGEWARRREEGNPPTPGPVPLGKIDLQAEPRAGPRTTALHVGIPYKTREFLEKTQIFRLAGEFLLIEKITRKQPDLGAEYPFARFRR